MGFFKRLFGGSEVSASSPVAYRRLDEGPPLAVVGTWHHRDAIDSALGRHPEGHHEVVDALLIAEPDNEFDRNAVAVQIGGEICGYLPRFDAVRYRPVMDRCRSDGLVPLVRAVVMSGRLRPDGSWADVGILLHIASPARLLGLHEPAAQVPSRGNPWVGQVIAFTGDSGYAVDGYKLDRELSEGFAKAAGIEVHARVTEQVRLLVDCDDATISGNQRKANEYRVPVIAERDFWTALGLVVEAA